MAINVIESMDCKAAHAEHAGPVSRMDSQHIFCVFGLLERWCQLCKS